jgi:hypothetical protein
MAVRKQSARQMKSDKPGRAGNKETQSRAYIGICRRIVAYADTYLEVAPRYVKYQRRIYFLIAAATAIFPLSNRSALQVIAINPRLIDHGRSGSLA